MQAVGEFDQQHAHVVGDREQQFAEILRLLRVPGGEVELVELGQSIDETADLRPEHLVDLLAGDGRVLDRVVQHRRDDRGVVELELGEDRGDLERMREIGVPGGSLLLAMRAHREDIGAIQQLLVRLRIVTADTLDQFVLTHHLMGWTSRRPDRLYPEIETTRLLGDALVIASKAKPPRLRVSSCGLVWIASLRSNDVETL